jgi:hypothetical protein
MRERAELFALMGHLATDEIVVRRSFKGVITDAKPRLHALRSLENFTR